MDEFLSYRNYEIIGMLRDKWLNPPDESECELCGGMECEDEE